MRCVFPKAISPFQKFVCGGLGVTALGVAGYATVKCIDFVNDRTKKSEVSERVMETAGGTVLGSLSLIPTYFAADFCKNEAVQWYKAFSSTECCTIMRRSFVGALIVPGSAILTVIFGGVAFVCFRHAWEYLTKKEEQKNEF